MIEIPLRTSRGQNAREHWRATASRVKSEKGMVYYSLRQRGVVMPDLPCVVTLTRQAPSKGLDSDNLQGALKAVRDEVANWLGVDDGDTKTVRYEYAQCRGPWAVRISWQPMQIGMTPEQKRALAGQMAMTWRHDFGLQRQPGDPLLWGGMTPDEQEALIQRMLQLIEHHWPK